MFLAQARDIPHPYGLIQGGRHNEIFFGMELCAHSIVVVPGHRTDYLSISLVVFRRLLRARDVLNDLFCQFHIRIV